MTPLDLSSLTFWEFVSEFGFVMVIVGVVGEAVELVVKWIGRHRGKELPKKETKWLLPFETLFFAILVIGLATEFLGSHKAMRIANRLNAELHTKAEQASKDAGEANERAGKAHERAANAERITEELRSANLMLRSNVAVLEFRINPRTFTQEQTEHAIKSLGVWTNTPFFVEVFRDPDSTRFGERLTDLLKNSGWTLSGFANGLDVTLQKGRYDLPRTQEPVGVEIEISEMKHAAAAGSLNLFLSGCNLQSRVVTNLHPSFVIGGYVVRIRVGTHL